jgi:diguanylate cyclase (GGDEF)-like protein/PAS domain S-box-containing protein
MLVVAPDSTIRYATPSAEAVLGAKPEQLDGRRLADLAAGDGRAAVERALVAAGGPGASHRPADWRLGRPDGASVVVEAVTSAPDGEGADLVVTLRDVGERRALEGQLRHRAFHDELTGLANRPLFEDRTTGALARARRSGQALAVLFLDLDDFKTVNDALGHGAGDELLCEAARRVAADLRASDTAARLGGDEFALLLDGVDDGHAATAAAERLLEALAAPFSVAGKEVFVRASVGLAIDSGRRTADELLRDADAAMYEAKRQGKGRVVRFEPGMHASVLGRLQLRADLERALDRDELVLHYQPIVRLDTGEVEQLEALVRWRHAERGLVPPDEFIPLAEETGFIVALGRHVLRAACREARGWADLPGGRPVGVSVNVSPRQLAEPGFVDEVTAALADAGLPATSLVLEITEHALMGDADAIAPGLHELRAAGVRIALDDFGTGYSSLAYLRHVPLDSIKVDRGFVGELDAAGDHPLVRSITGLGESLGLRVVAEGIEERHQLEALRALGCELGQGYLFSKPLPADQVAVTLAAGSLLAPPESA